jgi:menaquinone-dependent protoporphyrinogen IX oxidase
MLLWILYDTNFGNGKKVAEFLQKGFPNGWKINIGDVKKVDPKTVVNDSPDALILGGAIRMFQSAPLSKRWLQSLDKELAQEKKKIQFGAMFLTHGLSTNKIQGFTKRYLAKLKKSQNFIHNYPRVFTGRVQGTEGPLVEDVHEKSTRFVNDFIQWMNVLRE